MIEHLSHKYRFLVITRDTDYCDDNPYQQVKSDQWNEYNGSVKVYYFSKKNLNRKNLLAVTKEANPDIIYLNGIYSWAFSILPLLMLRGFPVKKVIAPRGMLSIQAFSSSSIKKKIFLSAAKGFQLYRDITFQATSEQEILDIKHRISKGAKIIQAPNLPKKANDRQQNPLKKEQGQLKLITIARVSPEKNYSYIIRLLKGMTGLSISLDCYGPIYDKPYYEQCLSEAQNLPKGIEINFKGPASPEVLDALLPNYHFLLFPTTGENFGHAIYEAMICGVPVILSDKTPWRGLEASSAGWDLPLVDKDKWENVLRKCYDMEQEEYDNLCNGAQQVAVKYMQQSDFIKKYEQLFGDPQPSF